ncbi:hypothetical protein CNYM01_13049 [Colletotrichum nymphaeae SA-01]|uniref:Uncharacterized protein n=1 Tax=Colletotrichum nymphaeae SA-01 TaxID=1460502 RepID=A0A135TKC1_9PEZI|nr:hypothetical protein CNYM01_13049 [Colletotrichum nymphaeae SA-01]
MRRKRFERTNFIIVNAQFDGQIRKSCCQLLTSTSFSTSTHPLRPRRRRRTHPRKVKLSRLSMEAPTDPAAPAQSDEVNTPNPPYLAPVATIEELQAHLQAHARDHSFAVTGTTDIGSLYNCAFGLISTERREGYDFLIEARANETLSLGKQPQEIPHTPTGFCQLWAYVMYAKSEEDFDAAWDRLTNGPTETAHKDLKSYVINGNSDLYAVAQAIEEMLRNKSRTYTERVAAMESRTRYEYLRRDWLGTVSKEHQRALPSLPTDQIPRPPDLSPCSGSFTNQDRLPCSHKLLDLMKRNEPLTKMYIHPRWWLRQPLNLRDALLNIKDPAIITTLRGRPKNKNIACLPRHHDDSPLLGGTQLLSSSSTSSVNGQGTQTTSQGTEPSAATS